ncbi:MAG: alpha-L-rhamnosidase N-terminal domain-containing protein [Armatimonadetes bacterium]|nr:alpha-L-rhamnosidase N-terminal domain-containing protein [Armatimonadota bacterium]
MPTSATFNLFADARYVLWINGRYCSRGPARFEPSGPEYDPIPVAQYLKRGKNQIAILVIGRVSNGKTRWRPLGMTANLMVGNRSLIQTDSTWRWSEATRYRKVLVDWANLYDVVDARAEDGDWTNPEYDDSRWKPAVRVAPNPALLTVTTRVDWQEDARLDVKPIGGSWWGPLSRRRTPLLRETKVEPAWTSLLPVTLRAGEKATFRFAHLVLATTGFEADAEEGSEIRFSYLPQTSYICKGGTQSFVTTDSHAIFEGSIEVIRGRVTFKKIEFSERLYPFAMVGSFRSSDPLLDRLWKTCVRGLEVTSEDAYVDCTDRERVEWMDTDPPAFDVTRVAMAGPPINGKPTYSDPRLLESMLRRTALTLQPEGWVKAHTCSDRFDIHAKMEDRACDWVEGARRYVESTGQTKVVREIWPAMVRQMDYFLSHKTKRGLVLGREWTVWGNPVGYQTCEGTTLNAFVCRALFDAASLGRKIGENKGALRFEAAAKELSNTINKVLWDEDAGTYFAGFYDLDIAKAAPDYRPLKLQVTNGLIEPTRHAALFMLDQGVVPADRIARTTAYLMSHPPHENDIMQYYYFWKQCYRLDTPDADLQVLDMMRREWKDMAESPFEATFEGLHSWGSQAHGYGMFPAYFLSSYVLGVRREGNGLLIEPRLADLTHASGVVATEFGPVDVEWKLGKSGGSFKLTIPRGTKAILRLPAGQATLTGELSARFRKHGRWLEISLKEGLSEGTWR